MIKTSKGFQWLLYREFTPRQRIGIEDIVGRVEMVIDGYVEEDTDDILDKNVCRRVRIGTETREYPTYKIVCPEDN